MGGCCEKVSLSLGRFKGFVSAYLHISLEITLKDLDDSKVSGQIGVWARTPAVTDLELGIDSTNFTFAEGKLVTDVDQDGYDETVKILVAIDDRDQSQRAFIAWKGDKYTLDKNRCYLAWQEGRTARLVSGRCDGKQGAIWCHAPSSKPSKLVCQVCDQSGECVDCDTDEPISECDYPESEDAGAKTDASLGIDVSVPLDASVSVELSPCEKEVVELARETRACSIEAFLDEQRLCEQSATEVNVCYLAYQAADLIGQSTCAVLRDDFACGQVLNGASD